MSNRTWGFGLVISLFLAGQSIAQVSFTTVAISGEQAPGMPVGVLFNGVQPPAINQLGQVAFRAFAFGQSPIVNENGIWSGQAGNLSLVAKGSEQAVGTDAGVTYGQFFGPTIADSGGVFFASTLEGSGVVPNQNNRAYFSSATGPLSLVARTGSQAPAFPEGVTYRALTGAVQAPNGMLSIMGRVQGSFITLNNDTVIWQGFPGSLSVVARTGMHAPGTSAATVFQYFYSAYVMNGAGTVSFRGNLTGQVGALDGQGIWSGQPGSLQLQVRSGTQAPGSPAGAAFFNLGNPSINNSDRIAFTSGLTGAGFTSVSDGIWSKAAGGNPELVALRNMIAPLPAPDVSFSGFSDPFLMGNDQVAFRATLMGSGVNGGNDGSIWRGMPGSIQAILREGDHAPGTPDGVNFGTFLQGDIAGNDAGQIIIRSSLTGSGVDASNNLGVWLSDPTLGLILLARTGTPFEVAPGILKTPEDFFINTQSGGQDGRPTGLMSANQFAFGVRFRDATGVFIATVPEPSSGLLGLIAASLVALKRRCRGRCTTL